MQWLTRPFGLHLTPACTRSLENNVKVPLGHQTCRASFLNCRRVRHRGVASSRLRHANNAAEGMSDLVSTVSGHYLNHLASHQGKTA